MTSDKVFEGFYTAYLTGIAGQSVGIFVFSNGRIVGADAGGGCYDGEFSLSGDGSTILADVKFTMKKGGALITGASSDTTNDMIPIKLSLPCFIHSNQVHRLETPIGPINAKFEKIRGM